MMSSGKRMLIVRLVDKTTMQFEFPPQADEMKLAARVEKLLESKNLALQLDERLLIIPAHNILSVEITPAPTKLPENTIRNVHLAS
jgi:hypothetical protein